MRWKGAAREKDKLLKYGGSRTRIRTKGLVISVALAHDAVEGSCSFLKARAITREHDVDVSREALSRYYLP